jgi:hypothetical protein
MKRGGHQNIIGAGKTTTAPEVRSADRVPAFGVPVR